MLARLMRSLPVGAVAYEPKWDGFRCLAFRTTDGVCLQSRNERPLQRYFPEVVATVARLPTGTVVDGEIVLVRDGDVDFPALLERIHPAASRVEQLAMERPARFIGFDCLATQDADVMAEPFAERRRRLESLVDLVDVTPLTLDAEVAGDWFARPQPGWDGVVAKDLDGAYQPGKRVIAKVKHERTADCIVAGVRLNPGGVSSMLLGLWTTDGQLHHPGVVSSPPRAVKDELTRALQDSVVRLDEHPWRHGFGLEGGSTGRLKGAGGRWLPGMTQDWVPLAPTRVVEVAYDRVDRLRFRHPARWRRWRPDRDAATCGVDQLRM
jgi:ATP-dependent DNA ligase